MPGVQWRVMDMMECFPRDTGSSKPARSLQEATAPQTSNCFIADPPSLGMGDCYPWSLSLKAYAPGWDQSSIYRMTNTQYISPE